ncbi:MAG TPA: SDR family oxidoreductase [Acidimicrobiales bacterium]|nr:SDR family oxidoreductase [Acidimicrobiales bacterium]
MSFENPFSLAGKTAIVTGGGGLIGRAIAKGMAGQGADVVVVDINGRAAAAVADELDSAGTKAYAITGDVSTPEGVTDVVDQAVAAVGDINVLVNNAGRGSHNFPEDISYEEWSAVFQLDLTGYFLMAQAIGRHMLERNIAGAIVMTSSTCGHVAMGRGNFAFSIAKAGVNQLVRELALEWGFAGIRVNAIAPCQVEAPSMDALLAQSDPSGTDLRQRVLSGIPLGRLARAEDMAGPAVFLASDAAAMVTGTVLAVDGGNLASNAASSIRHPVSGR